MTSAIHSRAMLVSLKLSKWSASKYDKKISEEIAAQHNADSDAGRYNKRLIPKGKNSYAELITAYGALYSEHMEQTLPWSDEGWRLLPMANHSTYTAMIRKHRATIEPLLNTFLADYPTIQAEVKQRVNGLFNPADWPEPLDLRKRFSIKVDYNPVPASEDFRVQLDSETLKEITRDTEDRVNNAVIQAQADAIDRLKGCVERIASKLADPEGIFRDSLIENARDLTDALTRLNVTDDPRLEDLRHRVEQMARVSPEALRSLPFQRATTASEAQNILDRMSAVFGGAA